MSRPTAKRAITTSFFVDLGDIAINVIAMIITGSVVLLAEALEGGSDLVASGLLFVGLKISKKRSDKNHPFGFGKALFSWTLLSVMVMLIFGAGLSFYFGLQRFLDPHDIRHIGLAYGALAISICTNGFALSVSTRRLLHGKPIKELKQTLKDSTHVETKNTFILDLTGTSAAVVGMTSLILYQLTGLKFFDGLGGMMMGLIIAVSSVILIWGVKDYLIGKSAIPEIEKQMKEIILEESRVRNILEFKTMYIGSEKLMLHLDIEVNKSTTAKEITEIVESLKEKLKKEFKMLTSIQIETVAAT